MGFVRCGTALTTEVRPSLDLSGVLYCLPINAVSCLLYWFSYCCCSWTISVPSVAHETWLTASLICLISAIAYGFNSITALSFVDALWKSKICACNHPVWSSSPCHVLKRGNLVPKLEAAMKNKRLSPSYLTLSLGWISSLTLLLVWFSTDKDRAEWRMSAFCWHNGKLGTF